MTEAADLADLVRTHGLALLLILSIIEGPIVTVLAAYLASQGLLPIGWVVAVAILGDVLGDILLYGIGRAGLAGVKTGRLRKFGVDPGTLGRLADLYRARGVQLLILAKLTHSAGAAAILGAGAARMAIPPFLAANLAAGVPKVLILALIGWEFGAASQEIQDWIMLLSAVVLVLLAVLAIAVWLKRRRTQNDA